MTSHIIKTVNSLADRHFFTDAIDSFDSLVKQLVDRKLIINNYNGVENMLYVLEEFSISARVGNVSLFSETTLVDRLALYNIYVQYRTIDHTFKNL